MSICNHVYVAKEVKKGRMEMVCRKCGAIDPFASFEPFRETIPGASVNPKVVEKKKIDKIKYREQIISKLPNINCHEN